MDEKIFEDIICKYPELIENNLSFRGRQVTVKGKRVDVLFEDRHGQILILEIKKGTVLRDHVGQLLDYEGNFVSDDNPNVRVMLVGNRVPENLRRSLNHHGFEWKELTIPTLVNFISAKDDPDILRSLTTEEPLVRDNHIKSERHSSGVGRQTSLPVVNQSSYPIDIVQGISNDMKKYNKFIREGTNTIFRQNDVFLNGAQIYFNLSGDNWRSNDGRKDAIVYFSRSSNNLVVIPRKAVDMYIFDPLFQKTPKGYYLIKKYKNFALDAKDRISFKFETKHAQLLVILKAFIQYNVDPTPLISLPSAYWPEINLENVNSPSKLVEEIRRLCQELSNCEGIVPIKHY